MNRRILITIEYKGSAYCGWQIQKGCKTVQGELTDALARTCGHPIKLVSSGRTDEGVHAIGQTAHFDTDCTIPPARIREAANIHLPDDIKIMRSQLVSPDFHAIRDAVRKTYIYKMYTGRVQSPLHRLYFAHIPFKVDERKMNQAAAKLVGTHDFTSFMATGSSVKTTVRTIYWAQVKAEENQIIFTVSGNGFLYNMVRIIAGTLMEAGRGKVSPEDITAIIAAKDRSLAGKTAPACGLYLKSVEYK